MDLREDDVVAALFAAVRAKNVELELEQAPHGLDSWQERALQGVLADGLRGAGFFVAREQRYPGDRGKRQRTSGRRCDLVVTAGGPLVLEDAQPELFTAPAVPPAEAAWVEVKVLKQFGQNGPNRGWEKALLKPPTVDIARLAGEPGLRLRGLLLLLFCAGVDVADHDLGVWRRHVMAKGLSLGPPALLHLPLVDRRGNRSLSLAFMPVSTPTRLG